MDLLKRVVEVFFRCESMWTGILMGLVALMFFLPKIFENLSKNEQMAFMGILIVWFFFISLFIWTEQAYDERELAEQLQMNKWAFIVGGGTIMGAIVYQSLSGKLDLVLPIILLVMLGTKLVLKNYYRLRNIGILK